MPVADTIEELARLVNDPESGVVRDLPGLVAKLAEGGTVLSRIPVDDAFRFVQDVKFGTGGLACLNFNPLLAHLSDSELGEVLAMFGISQVMRENVVVTDAWCSKTKRKCVPFSGWNCIPGPGHCGPRVVTPSGE